MSLDISVLGEPVITDCTCTCGNCHTKETRETFWSATLTGNLVPMAQAAGIYGILWEIKVKTAQEMIGQLDIAIGSLKSNPIKFKQFNPKNGYGDYDSFVKTLESFRKACQDNPDGTIDAG